MKHGVKSTSRRLDLEIAKGIAIILVVYGHVVARDLPDGAALYSWGKGFIYSFHMPFFMWISGFVFALSWNRDTTLGSQMQAVLPRVGRLIPAFLTIGIAIFLGKLIVGSFVELDNPVSAWTNLFDLILRPTASFSSFLWYIYVLAFMFIATPLLTRMCRGRTDAALLIALSLWLTPPSDWFAWVRIRELAVFFIAGIYWQSNENRLNEFVDRVWPLALIGLPLIYLISGNKLVCGLIGTIALFGLARSSLVRNWSLVAKLGAFTFSIYLFNTICIGATKALLSLYFSWHGNAFYAYFPVLFLAGLLVPVLLKQALLSRIPAIDKFT